MKDLTLPQNPPKKNKVKENWLVHLPILGYFLRKIAKNRAALERTLRTGKETKGETKKISFLYGLLGMISGKKFNTLKIRKGYEKSKRKTWFKPRQN